MANNKFLFILVWLIFTASTASGEKTIVLKESFKRPGQVLADKDHLYITDFPTIHIYNRYSFKLIKSFGSHGEGPQEFKQYINVFFQDKEPDRLVVSSIGKISFYTRAGKYIRETKIPFGGWSFQPLGKKFIGHTLGGNDKEGFKALNLYSRDLKKIRELYRKEFFFDDSLRKRVLFTSNYRYITHQGVVYVNADQEFVIRRFDQNGKPLPVIRLDYQRVRCTEKHREIVLNWFKNNTRTRETFERLKNRIAFPDYFPAIREITADKEKLFVLTYKREKGQNQFYILNLKGKLLEEKYMKIQTINGVSPFPLAIKGDRLYQIYDNADTESWEIKISAFGPKK